MGVKISNNAVSTITSAISNTDTGITITPDTGSLFPTLGAGDYFYATLFSTTGAREIVKVTSRVADVMTVVRAQEGTSAQGFSAGSRFELRITAASITDMVDAAAKLTDLASTAAGKGASLIGVEGGGTVQTALVGASGSATAAAASASAAAASASAASTSAATASAAASNASASALAAAADAATANADAAEATAAATSASASAATATVSAGQALQAATTAQGFCNVLSAPAATLPFEVRSISGGIGTGIGGTPGTYVGGVSGGPAGFMWSYTIGLDGKLASYAIDNPGIATTNAAPTLSFPLG